MKDNNDTFSNYIFTKYYIFSALFQTIWSVAVLGFTVFLVLYFQNYWVLFSLILLFLHPYKMLQHEITVSEDKKEELRKKYGTNNPPQ